MPLLSFLFWFHCCMSLTHSASSQTVSKEGERIKMFLTPTICKVRCSAGRCTNYCEHGNVTTLYSNEPIGQPPSETGFRIFLCPMLCQNGGVCIQKDRCQCPQNFTGKFCHIPATSSTNDIEKSQLNPSVLRDQQLMSQSEYLLPLQSEEHHQTNAESSMVKVRVQHPPEASIKIHQVLKVGTGETGRAQQDTVTRTTRVLEARNSLPGEKAEALSPQVQAQDFLGDSADTESSVFKYCFREFRNGQCSSRLPGLRTPKTCCEGTGIAWGINECILCPSHGNGTDGDKQCPKGYERINDTQCVDINECLQPGRCQNGNCINTRGSYSCVCRQGFLLDASHRICVSEKVISEDKGQCYRLLSSGVCSLPILRNITKQICCCSRVGKAWGRNCEKCPYFGSDAFKETCPAGPGYHYSPFAHQPNQKVTAHHDAERTILTPQRQAQPPRDHSLTPQRVPEPPSNPGILGSQTRTQSSATDLFTTQKRTDRLSNASTTTQSTRVLTSSTQRQSIHQANRQEISSLRPVQPAAVTPRLVQPRPGFQGCDSNPQLCGPGRCVDLPGERYTCICTTGYQLNLQRTRCFDIDECRRTPSPCDNGYCENVPGSFRCVCFTGYELRGNTCIDINECKNDLQCPGQECVNTKGSFRCVPCRPGFELKNQQCQDIDECRTPSPCENGYCQNIPGSFRCRCFTGYELRSNTCLDINECKNDLQCPGQECVNTKGSFRCVPCRPGFELKNQQCQDIDECRRTPSPCDNGYCENVPGSFRCVCFTGYELRGNTCIDIDECRTPSPCDNGYCENVPGSFRCRCFTGYELQGNTCIDIDECKNDLQCPGQECVNTKGSFRCVPCRPGFELKNQQCQDIDECRTPSPCDNGYCENVPGSFRCRCFTGYELQGNTCIDIDECKNDLQCPGQECVNTKGSFRCVPCRPGFELKNQQCQDIDECRTPSPCENGYCENVPGSFRCRCFTGYELQGNTCIDIDECKNDLQCPGQECVNTKGSFRCVPCRPGFELKNQQCQDIDECRTPSPCDNGYCENVPGSFRCRCFTGYELQGNTCIDINECKNDLQCPGQECVNTKGSFRCVPCRPGFELKNQQCQDVDECQQNPSPCVNSQCENSPGSYQCVCFSGYELEGNSCVDVDECEDPSQCAGQECVNLKGSYRCIPCQQGYVIKNGRCTDVDECQSLQGCGPEGLCVNTAGSYHCDCQPGYRAAGLGHQCKDINECFEGEYCFPHGECMNTEGSYLCVCSEGFKSSNNLSSCIDVDECARPEACQDGSCVNTQGSFQCQCDVGFMTNPEQTTCLDKDECADSGGAICWPKRCENTIGSYYCVTICEPGYAVSHSGECMDINECVNETICGEHTFCQNLIGTYQCMCNQGYKATDNGKGCEDENECETIQGVCGTARCENMEGSFLCECPGENEEFDLRLRRCFSRPQSGRLPIPNGSSYSSSFSFWNPDPQVPIDSAPVSPPASLPGELRECYYNTQDQSTCRVLTRNSTYQECCCTVGEGWGLHCQYSPCPSPGSVAYQALCPSGRGYVTSESGVYSYRDVDECKLFDPEVCKRGLCVNNIPGYACYCPTGYYYHTILLECTDNDECEGEVACFGGTCVNTMGSFYCSCQPPLVLDYTQRTCVNLTGFTIDENLAICWGQVTELICQNPLLDRQVTFSECCCLYGYAWGLDCALCPSEDSDDFEVLCNALRPPGMRRAYSPGADRDLSRDEEYDMPYESYPERPAPGSDFTSPGYNPYISLRGRTSGYRGRPLGSYRPQESPYDRQTYASRGTERRPYLQTSDVVSEPVYEALPRPRSRGSTRSLPPRRQSAGYRDLGNEDGTVDETRLVESWMRFLPEEARSYPSYPSQPSGRAISERRYESYQSFSSDECGIVNGCENGRCIRISEGYTCDCYDGYYLDIASMSCIDINECEETDDPATLCVNGQCVNTDGSYRCICERGYVMYHEPNLCIPSRSRP
ncbi:latent-transforming growth factor beta-binding protein 4 isoform X8 [Brienomyrus brachyistius]|uniref:latent-transforming growth factor beta-binding protein 4 isoform X6 n=1 Tax=Brienomyrus brachyistius TaxID=42636 RepID=UPI0020B40C3F|nr:latent-transforming growth factor beta-binding protein 4 isoform X6 [Brienomyrus brachyistius]XP_048837082.1 latent-transforming growth factor beta-binding protein 4 isoform X8 [Brienomyrus brachyistius]